MVSVYSNVKNSNLMLYMYTVDINECSEGLSSCNQICINTVEGYNCDCYFGFALSSDNHTCQGQ